MVLFGIYKPLVHINGGILAMYDLLWSPNLRDYLIRKTEERTGEEKDIRISTIDDVFFERELIILERDIKKLSQVKEILNRFRFESSPIDPFRKEYNSRRAELIWNRGVARAMKVEAVIQRFLT